MANQISLWQAVQSVLASFIGIQSKKNMERDANADNMKKLIIVGISLAIILHAFLYLIAKFISWQVGVE